MVETPSDLQARDRQIQARKTIEDATLPVQTDSLTQRGIRRLRIVSESRLAELIGQMVESGKLPLPVDSQGAERAQEAWTRVREAYLSRLEHIETVAARLSESLIALDLVLRDLEAHGTARVEPSRFEEPHERRRAALLREMLLEELTA